MTTKDEHLVLDGFSCGEQPSMRCVASGEPVFCNWCIFHRDSSNPPRHAGHNEAYYGQDRSAPDPLRLIDHEAGGRIGEIAASLSNPNQAKQRREKSGYKEHGSQDTHSVPR
jgi:hypothetical protein